MTQFTKEGNKQESQEKLLDDKTIVQKGYKSCKGMRKKQIHKTKTPGLNWVVPPHHFNSIPTGN